jgi:hypothetical protein
MEQIIKQFKNINRIHEKMIELSEKKFIALKVKDMVGQKQLIQQEALCQFDLQESLEELKKIISTKCVENNITEVNLENLLPFMSIKEKEEVMACRRYAISHERKLKTNFQMYEKLIQALKESNELLMEAVMHVAEQEDVGGNLFINKEL